MKFRRLGAIIAFMFFSALLYCYFMVSVFTKKCYTQHDLLVYQLLTPKFLKQAPRVSSDWFFVSDTDEGSQLQRSEIVFTGVPKNDVLRAEERLNAYVESYPASREMMSVVVEASAGNYNVKVIHYESDE
ncbi:hypothetical protein [Citrobacter sp. Igbk 16]|uniref:hypothetical protein n=1 Tax=Citrobacter sp. Igbk 16 TaxID=2963958 RepID=UPI002303C3BD|nr:hypothetical protein [Citrobacter sp. Igbk 16]MDA8517049.1 hypothetical protein [Citrobacter sp. Igbk 16]